MLLSNICILQAFPDKDSSPAFLFQYQFFLKSSMVSKPFGNETWSLPAAACVTTGTVTPQAWRHGKQCCSCLFSPYEQTLCLPQLHPAMKVTQTELGHFARVWSWGCGRAGRAGHPMTGVTMMVIVSTTHLITGTWNFFPLS